MNYVKVSLNGGIWGAGRGCVSWSVNINVDNFKILMRMGNASTMYSMMVMVEK